MTISTLVLATDDHADELRKLQKILRCYQGFQLLLVLYNAPPYRDRLIACLNEPFSHPALLDVRNLPDFASFEARISACVADADLIHVIGLDAWLLGEQAEQRLQSFNLRRESIASCCTKPLILWLPEYLAREFALQAPDCWEWRRAVIDFSYLLKPSQENIAFSFDSPRQQLNIFEHQLRQLSPTDYQHAKALAVFNDAVTLEVLAKLMDWTIEDAQALAISLVEVDLAKAQGFNHFSLETGLCAYLRLNMDVQKLIEKQDRWRQLMFDFIVELANQHVQNPEKTNRLSILEWANISILLEQWQQIGSSDKVIELCSALFYLLQFSGNIKQLVRIAQVRDQAEQNLSPVWGHARFLVQQNRIENSLQAGQILAALQQAQSLLTQTLQAGINAYTNATYDIATAQYLLGNVLSTGGYSEVALKHLKAAQQSFQNLADNGNQSSVLMVAITLGEQGNCLVAMGRLDKAVEIYLQSIDLNEKLGYKLGVAVNKGRLATVHVLQKNYPAALAAYQDAIDLFSQLNEPKFIASCWHGFGSVYMDMRDYKLAEHSFRESIKIDNEFGNKANETISLNALGNLYYYLGQLDQAATLYRQAVDNAAQLGNKHDKGLYRSNLSISLNQLQRYDEARNECLQAIECKRGFGHSVQLWETWEILHQIEQACNNPTAAHAAKQQAIIAFLIYRRDGGENMDRPQITELCQKVLLAIHENQTEQLIKDLSGFENLKESDDTLKPVIPKLVAVLQGQRDIALANDPELNYNDAAELLLLLEAL